MGGTADSAGLIIQGPAEVFYGGHSIGHTVGDVVFTYSPEFRLFVPDQNTAPEHAFLVNETIEVVIPLVPTRDGYNMHKAKAYSAASLKSGVVGGGGSTTLTNSEAAGASVLEVPTTTGFSVGDTVMIDSGIVAEIVKITAIAPGVSITIEPVSVESEEGETGLQRAHEAGAAVVEVDGKVKLTFGAGDEETFDGGHPADELKIVPQSGPSLILYRALCTGEAELGIKKGEESVVELTYTALADTSRGQGDELAAFGDLSVA